MANDIEINVRVANQTPGGLTGVNTSLSRLKERANEASEAVAGLRTTLASAASLEVNLDDNTEAGIEALRARMATLDALSPLRLNVEVTLDDNTEAGFDAVLGRMAALEGLSPLRLDAEFHGDAAEFEASAAAVQASIDALKAESPVRFEMEFQGDSAEVTAAAEAVRELKSRTTSAGTALGTLAVKATTAAAALVVLSEAADMAAASLRSLRSRAASAGDALGDMRTGVTSANNSMRTLNTRLDGADGRMQTLSTRSETLRERMNELSSSFGRAGGEMSGLRGNLGSMSASTDRASRSSHKLLAIALTLAPALVPLAAAIAPVTASMGAAGVATIAFGAAIFGQFKAIGDASKAQDKYTKAVGKHGEASSQAAEAESKYLEQVGALPQVTQEASAALGRLTSSYQAWSDSLAPATMPVAMKSFSVLTGLFPRLTPLVQGASQQLDRFMTILAGGVRSPGFEKMMNQFAVFATDSLAKGISGLVRFGQAMEEGGSHRSGIASFMEFARANGPAVGETLRNLGEAIRRLLVASADTGLGILSIVNAFARLVNAIPPEVLARLVELAVAFKAVSLASAGIAVIAPRLAAAGTAAAAFTRAAQFGGVQTAIQGVTASLTAMQKTTIVLAVITAAVIAVNELSDKAKGAPPNVDALTDSLKRLGESGKFTGELKRTFGDMDQFVKQAQQMRVANDALEKSKPFTSLIPMFPIVDKFLPKLDSLVNGTKSLTATTERFKAFDESFASLAKSGHADEAAKQFKGFEEALLKGGYSTQQVAAIFPQYQAALTSVKAEQELAARSMGLFGEQAVAVSAQLNTQKQSADGLRQAITALNETNRSALGGMIGFEAAIDAAAEAAKKNADSLNMTNGVLDLNSEKARNAASALQDLASKTDEAAGAARANGESWETVHGIYERGREKLVEAAAQMGLTKNEAASLAAQILATPDKTAMLRGDMEDLQAKLSNARAQLASVPDSRRAEILANIRDLEEKVRRAAAELSGLDDRTVYVRTIYQEFRAQHMGGQADAHGGIVGGAIGAAGGGPRSRMTLVGEQGPELVDLAPGSRVRSNPDSRRIADGMAGGGGGGPVVLELRSSGSRVDDFLLEALRGAIRVKGGNVQVVLGSNR